MKGDVLFNYSSGDIKEYINFCTSDRVFRQLIIMYM